MRSIKSMISIDGESPESSGSSVRRKRQVKPKAYNEIDEERENKFLKKKRKIMKIKRGSNVLWTEEEVSIYTLLSTVKIEVLFSVNTTLFCKQLKLIFLQSYLRTVY